MYIKSIEFHFNTGSEPMVVTGKDAQFFGEQMEEMIKEESVWIIVKGNLKIIPKSEIDWIEIVEHDHNSLAIERLEKEREEALDNLCAYIRRVHRPIKYVWDMPVAVYYVFLDINDWEMTVDNGLRMGKGNCGEDVVIYDQQAIWQYQQILLLGKKIADKGGENVILTVKHMTCFIRNGVTSVRIHVEGLNGAIVAVRELSWKEFMQDQDRFTIKRLASAANTKRA